MPRRRCTLGQPPGPEANPPSHGEGEQTDERGRGQTDEKGREGRPTRGSGAVPRRWAHARAWLALYSNNNNNNNNNTGCQHFNNIRIFCQH